MVENSQIRRLDKKLGYNYKQDFIFALFYVSYSRLLMPINFFQCEFAIIIIIISFFFWNKNKSAFKLIIFLTSSNQVKECCNKLAG